MRCHFLKYSVLNNFNERKKLQKKVTDTGVAHESYITTIDI